jgi:hypothetical protein
VGGGQSSEKIRFETERLARRSRVDEKKADAVFLAQFQLDRLRSEFGAAARDFIKLRSEIFQLLQPAAHVRRDIRVASQKRPGGLGGQLDIELDAFGVKTRHRPTRHRIVREQNLRTDGN